MKALVTLLALAGIAAHAGPAAAATPPATAHDLAALPDGGWLALERQSLKLIDGAGRERASLPVRGRQLDTRVDDSGMLAVVVDANLERVQPLLVRDGRLTQLPPVPAPAFGIEAACLYRDAQRLDYVFLVGKDGQAEQWLLQADGHRQVRRLALPPHVGHCRVDDASATLFVAEEDFGLWAYNADAEGPGARQALALTAPLGTMKTSPGALALVPGGVAVLDGEAILTWHRDGKRWKMAPRQAAGKAVKALATDGRTLLAHTKAGWRAVGLVPRAAAAEPVLPIVLPRAQTEPVARAGDAADDPAIWRNPRDPAGARILGTNKKQGLLVYDIAGRQLQLLESGRLNNVDVRQDVTFGADRFDIAVATQRDENSIVLFSIDATGKVSEAARLPTTLDEIYGACLYQPRSGGLQAFVNDKDGRYLHYRLERAGGKFAATLLRTFRTASQPEGCVADDAAGTLFVGEEKRGVWVTPADAQRAAPLTMALPVGALLTADVEGMGLYRGPNASYLVVSSQGSNSYVVLDAQAPYTVRGAFRIGINVAGGIDGASETDGLEVTSADLGGPYGKGMLVVQDGYKRLPDGAQNFKYVAWADIAAALKLP
ncbi:phytase [Pseudoduganella plicata]|uniref:Phytase n=1 Tax=Pseudoduganella plicata TaxID=321984 RepID=A0A4P7BCW7_9BURK|nr:phytase [Pseudoduganella plicata]QBQ35325.1 phytase [Pseudoduganella plicata]GGZ00896.1 3-phytase [Pseudoduganella plicata]